MVHVVKGTVAAQRKYSSDIEQCLDNCKEKLASFKVVYTFLQIRNFRYRPQVCNVL